jgi:glutathione S-transferase
MLRLYFHPLASFCHKVLIALYENETPFEGVIVDLQDPKSAAPFLEKWPVGKIPVLHDEGRDRTIPETTIILEYLARHCPAGQHLFPADEDERLNARLWDRFFDSYVQVPMQKIVVDRLRAEGERDARGVADARQLLKVAYPMIEKQVAGKTWVLGEQLTIADCAAAPALFYAGIVEPFAEYPSLSAYFERLLKRPSFRRTLLEAQPYFGNFPYRELMPKRFLDGTF